MGDRPALTQSARQSEINARPGTWSQAMGWASCLGMAFEQRDRFRPFGYPGSTGPNQRLGRDLTTFIQTGWAIP